MIRWQLPVPRLRYPPTAQQFAGVRLKDTGLAPVGLAVSAFRRASAT